MMWSSENEFRGHLVSLLQFTRTEIVEETKPFAFLQLYVDLIYKYNSKEEWRELKIINNKGKGRSILS